MAKVATKFFVEGEETCLQYHETIVARIGEHPELGTYAKCFTGGWLTQTTKERINSVVNELGANVYQEKGVWYILWYKMNGKVIDGDRPFVRFFEGIKVYANGLYEDQAGEVHNA